MSDNHPAGHTTTSTATDDAGLAARLTARFTAGELAAVRTRARALGIKPSAWVRAVVRDALDARRDEVARLHRGASRRPDPELAAAVDQLRRVGVNLNQERRARGAAAVDDSVLLPILAAVDSVRSSLGDRTVL